MAKRVNMVLRKKKLKFKKKKFKKRNLFERFTLKVLGLKRRLGQEKKVRFFRKTF